MAKSNISKEECANWNSCLYGEITEWYDIWCNKLTTERKTSIKETFNSAVNIPKMVTKESDPVGLKFKNSAKNFWYIDSILDKLYETESKWVRLEESDILHIAGLFNKAQAGEEWQCFNVWKGECSDKNKWQVSKDEVNKIYRDLEWYFSQRKELLKECANID